jgi:FkbM family methyltransferase
VIQAGGNAGLFPVMLAWQGCRVLTFEPLIENFNALVQNLRHVRNGIVWPVFGGLDDEAGQVDMLSMTGEVNNTGAGYTSATDQQGVPMYDIDTFFPHGDLDLVWLDVEGDELPALKGMETTILKHKPVIVLELKGLGSRRGYTDADVHAWLNERGYGGYAGIGRDVCFVPKTAR